MAGQPEKKYVDRGDLLQGVNRVVRDSRVPLSFARNIENYRLPDQKLIRRPGFSRFDTGSRIHGQQLAKHTNVRRVQISNHSSAYDYQETTTSEPVFDTPNSYALLRHHADYEWNDGLDHTVEFLYTMGEKTLLVDGSVRRSNPSVYNGSTYDTPDPRVPISGVVLYDQTIIANRCEIRYGVLPSVGIFPKSGENRYSRARLSNVHLPAMVITIQSTKVQAFFALLKSSDSSLFDIYSLRDDQLLEKAITWTEGSTIHIAVRYTALSRKVELVVDGDTNPPSYTLAASVEWAGATRDAVNGDFSLQSARKRDIVLMNECTVRGHMSSSCYRTNTSAPTGYAPVVSVQNAFADNAKNGSVLHLSPPRGSGMANFRIWSSARTSSELITNAYTEIAAPLPNDLKGDWPLNDGGGICADRKTARRYITLHNTFPQYIEDAGLLHGIGLRFRDNQYLYHRFEEISNLRSGVIEDVSAQLVHTFTPRRALDGTYLQGISLLGKTEPESDWTVQMQIRTAYSWQDNIGSAEGLTGSSTDRATYSSTGTALRDGSMNGVNTYGGRRVLKILSVWAGPTWIDQTVSDTHRAMLFSIEGSSSWRDTIPQAVAPLTRKVPLVQCWVDRDGFVHLEVSVRHTSAGALEAEPTKLHYKSSSGLSLDTVHVITLVKRAPTIEIWIDGTELASVVIDDTSLNGPTTYGMNDSSPIFQVAPYYISIGAAEVESDADSKHYNTQTMETDLNVLREQGKGSLSNCPGDFALGYFRFWSRGLSADEIAVVRGVSIDAKDAGSDLLINLEIDQITGPKVANKSRYSFTFDLGYSAFHHTTAVESDGDGGTSESTYYHPMAGFVNSDCLGYQPFPDAPTAEEDNKQGSECRMLAPYNSTLAKKSGIVAIFDDTLLIDKGATGVFSWLTLPSRGLLSEFSTTTPWDWALIGDRLVMTSLGALPKVFDGKTLSTLGFPVWRGASGFGISYGTDGNLTTSKWYGVSLAYIAERAGIQHISPRKLIPLDTPNDEIIFSVPPHPDPRVTSVHVYRTLPQDTLDDATIAPMQLIPDLVLPNSFSEKVKIQGADSDLAPVVLDITKTPAPVCAYSEAFEGHLILAGDALVADAVYFSDPGNPEVFDVVNNARVLEEGSGDGLTGLVSVFGVLLSFKANSVWRLDFAGPSQLLAEPLNKSIGALSRKSVRVFVNPDTGQTLAFFWSRHGPYLLDGASFSYIGFPIESEDTGGANSTPYDWLDPQSVSTLVVPEDSEIVCFYKEAGKDRLARAAVFNWRNKSWSFYTGQIGVIGEAFNLSSGIDSYTYLSLLGDRNGRIWKWGGSYLDGVTTPVEDSVQSYSSPTITVQSGGLTINKLIGLWVTVIREDYSDYFIFPILANTATTITLDTGYGSVGFTPQKNDRLLYGLPPALVEYPWDVLDLPFFDKKLTRLVTWHNKRLWHRFSRNWDTSTPSPWREMRDAEKQRKLTPVNFEGEAIKLSLLSFMRDSRIDGYGYDVAVFGEGKMPQ